MPSNKGPNSPQIFVYQDANDVAEAAASKLLGRLLQLQLGPDLQHIVLTGGTVGIQTLREAAANPAVDDVDWTRVHLWWGDERFLPAGDPDRNETQARDALITPLGVKLPAPNVHPIPPFSATAGVEKPADAARRYAAELASFSVAGADTPRFDVLLLGMGPDGHVASLFPGSAALVAAETPTVPVENSPKPPPERVSLTFPAIGAANEVWVVATGGEKAPAVAAAITGAPVVNTPAAGVRGQRATTWLIDSAAAQSLPVDAPIISR